MPLSRIFQLRARLLTAHVRKNPRLLHLVNRIYPSSPNSSLTSRSFSYFHNRQAKSSTEKAASNSALRDEILLTVAKVTREDSAVEAGTEFRYFQVPLHLIPSGWTNDLYELEACIGSNLHADIVDFPERMVPILSYTPHGGWWGCLVRAGGRFYVFTYQKQLFRLETPIGLTTLLGHLKTQAESAVSKEGFVPLESKLLEHPALKWCQLGEAEWTEGEKAYERCIGERDDHLGQTVGKQAMLKLTRMEYVEWRAAMVRDKAEEGWKAVREMRQQRDNRLDPAVSHGGGKDAMEETTRKEYGKMWEAIIKGRS